MSDAELRPIARALLSVSDKTGLAELARALAARGVELVSTGGTAKALAEAGLAVPRSPTSPAFPRCSTAGSRRCTRRSMAAAGAARRRRRTRRRWRSTAFAPIDLLVVNLYPFAATVARGAAPEECIENIDIGGPALIRAAAKNHDDVAVVTDPEDYGELLAALATPSDGATPLTLRRRLAGLRAYARTARL